MEVTRPYKFIGFGAMEVSRIVLQYSGGPQIRVSVLRGGRAPLDLRFRGSFEAKSFVRGPKIDPPGASERGFDLKFASCGYVRRCIADCIAVQLGGGLRSMSLSIAAHFVLFIHFVLTLVSFCTI